MWKSAFLTPFMMCETTIDLMLGLLREIRGVKILKVMGIGKCGAFHKQHLINIYYSQGPCVHAFPETERTTSGR